jgi:hypothetical protein
MARLQPLDKGFLIKSSVELCTMVLKDECPFLTLEGESGHISLKLNFGQEPMINWEREGSLETDEEGQSFDRFPKFNIDKENYNFSIEFMTYSISQYISRRKVVSGELVFIFNNGKIVDSRIKGSLQWRDLKREAR